MTVFTDTFAVLDEKLPGFNDLAVFSIKMMASLVKSLLLFGFLLVSLPRAQARPLIIDIDAKSYEGAQIGSFIGTEIKKNIPDIEKRYDSYLNSILSATEFEQLLVQMKTLKKCVDPVYTDEINAIAEGWQINSKDNLGDGKLSVNEFWLLQLLSDLTNLNKGSGFAVINSSTHNPIAARNVDWKNAQDLKNLQTINIYHYQDHTVVTIGLAGLVGVISGFNEQGLFVSLLDASELETKASPLADTLSSFELRNVLKDSATILVATQTLAEKSYPRSVQILLADQQSVAVLEQPAGQPGKLRQTDSLTMNEITWHNSQQLAVVNCFSLKESPRNCYTSTDYYRLGRLAELAKKGSEQALSVDDVIALMQDRANNKQAILNENTLQTVVFTPKDRTLYYVNPNANSKDDKRAGVEKYQLIKPASGFDGTTVQLAWMTLGVAVVGIGFGFYVSRWQKNNKQPQHDESIN